MESKNGYTRVTGRRPEYGPSVGGLSDPERVIGPGYNTTAYQAIIAHPTPRDHHIDRACEAADPNLFDPHDVATLEQAQEICFGCDFRPTCLDLGTKRRETGVWGGVLLDLGTPLAAPKRQGRPRKKKVTATAA